MNRTSLARVDILLSEEDLKLLRDEKMKIGIDYRCVYVYIESPHTHT